ncbi:MAG: hypothetical protein EXR03_07610 [Pseudolabrys sp.]|nr:hypothetical protein [Pseudolabrys sp.]MSP32668.1 hypothetical protein [Pseudolabrys sp.]
MPRHRAISTIALVFAAGLAAATAGCSGATRIFEDNNEGGWFSKPLDVFAKPDWARPASIGKSSDLGPGGPVGADDLVSADGRCAVAEQAQAAAPLPPADRPVGSVAGDLAGAPMPAAAPAAANPADGLQLQPGLPPVLGGIALGMTECQAVARAGLPGNVAISGGDKGERSVVLTYLTGTWPGIYHFSDGRLKAIDRAPAPPEPPKAPPKKKTTKKPAKKPAV